MKGVGRETVRAVSSGTAALLCGLLIMLAAQTGTAAVAPTDFAGHWERDYQLSDDVQDEFDSLYRRMRRQAERRSSSGMDRGAGGPSVSVGGANNSIASLVGLARMADLITDIELMEIEQEEYRIKIDREGSFALICDFYQDTPQVYADQFGKEVCGWDSHQLLIKIILPDGLTIVHRLTLAKTKDKLNVATTVISDRVSQPFTLDRVFRRYKPLPEDFECEETLTRGKVCRRARRGVTLSEVEARDAQKPPTVTFAARWLDAACLAGAVQLSTGTYSLKVLLALLAACVLAACSSQSRPPPPEAPPAPTDTELRYNPNLTEAALLDIGLVVLDPAIPEDPAEHRARGIFPEIREAEAAYLPFVLRRTLEDSQMWGAVRVFPDPEPSSELSVTGTILHSDGEKLSLQIRAEDSTGRVWFDRVYTDIAEESDYRTGADGISEPFQDLYNRIANDLNALRSTLTEQELRRIREVALIRYAGGLSPDAFEGFVAQDETGQYQLQRLPAEDDPMLARVQRIRDHEYLFIDTVDEQYAELFADMDQTYDLWRQSSLELSVYQRAYRRRAAERKDTTQRGSYEALRQTYNDYKWSRIQEQDAEQLARGFNNEVQPTVMEVEGRIVRLTGDLDTQYAEWRRILRRIFELETGLPAAEP